MISLQRLREKGKCKESNVWKERDISLICGFQRHDVNHVGPDDDHYQWGDEEGHRHLGPHPGRLIKKFLQFLQKWKWVSSKTQTHIKHRFEASIAAMLKGLLNSPIKEEREAGDEVDHPGEGDHLLKILWILWSIINSIIQVKATTFPALCLWIADWYPIGLFIAYRRSRFSAGDLWEIMQKQALVINLGMWTRRGRRSIHRRGSKANKMLSSYQWPRAARFGCL